MNLLFIGNSHTYYNSMPETVHRLLTATGQKAHVAMITEAGKNLTFHASFPASIFNIRYGEYDAVIAQDRATGFDPVAFREGAGALREMVQKAGARFYLYMPWAERNNRGAQAAMTEAYHRFCRENGCLFAPAGEVFTRLLTTESADLLYREDGGHATPVGSYAAAAACFYMLTGRKRVVTLARENDPATALGISPELCTKIHTEACRMVRLYNG